MQCLINEEVYLRQTADSSDPKSKVKSIDISSEFINISEKASRLPALLKTGVLDKDVLIYILGMKPIWYQGKNCKNEKYLLTQHIKIWKV